MDRGLISRKVEVSLTKTSGRTVIFVSGRLDLDPTAQNKYGRDLISCIGCGSDGPGSMECGSAALSPDLSPPAAARLRNSPEFVHLVLQGVFWPGDWCKRTSAECVNHWWL